MNNKVKMSTPDFQVGSLLRSEFCDGALFTITSRFPVGTGKTEKVEWEWNYELCQLGNNPEVIKKYCITEGDLRQRIADDEEEIISKGFGHRSVDRGDRGIAN